MAKDFFHNEVRKALENDGWTITHDPYFLSAGDSDLLIDLGAESLLAATDGKVTIAVEIKSFVTSSDLSEFHRALGQYLNYQLALEDYDPERQLFLAIPVETHREFFCRELVRKAAERYDLRWIVFDPTNQTIVEWKKN